MNKSQILNKRHFVKFLILSSLLVSGCTLDLKTKVLAKEEIRRQSIPVIENFFNLTYVENHAIAFGFLGEVDPGIRIPIIFTLPIAAVLLGLFLIWKMRNNEFRILMPLFIIIGGALGNIIDRALNGYVTDFLHFHYFFQYNFYVFNVADVLINVGMILILLQYKEFNSALDRVFSNKPIKKFPLENR